jgi:peroxiredoxin
MPVILPRISRRSDCWSLGAGAALLMAMAITLPMPLHAEAIPGKPAPEFKAIDSTGKTHALADFKGKTVVLEWTNDGCPYVQKHYGSGNMQTLQNEASANGVIWLTVISSAKGEQGYADATRANSIATDQKSASAAILLDPEGKLGRAYGAKTTPHMYIVDRDGKLVYNGAIDDKPTANPADINGARNYVREALGAVAAGKPVPVASTRAYGCSVKYKG